MKNRILSLVLAVLCMISTIPFTSLAVSAAEVEYSFRVFNAEDISDFDPPYGGGGDQKNFAFNGIKTEVTSFDDVSVKAFSKIADKITATRNEEVKEDYQLYLCKYDNQSDSNGRKVRMYDAQYAVVEYYYDTTNRDQSDPYGQDLVGKQMLMSYEHAYDYNSNKESDWIGIRGYSEPIVANSWQKAIFCLKDASNAGDYFKTENKSLYDLDSWKLYTFGEEEGLQMFKGDVFYVKNISFCSYDPSNPPNEDREVIFYLTQNDYVEDVLEQGRFLKLEGVKDLDTIIIPNPEDDEYGFDSMDGQRFSHWVRIDYGTKHHPGEEFIIDGNDTYFCGVYTKPQSIRFNYTGGVGKFDLDNCFRGDTIIMPDFPEDADIEYYGWKDNITGKVYKPGDEYVYSDIRVGFNAYIPQEFYYSTSGSIDGISDKVYTTFEELDAAIANEGGIGTIFVAGNLELSHTAEYQTQTYRFESTSVKITGYDSNATVTFNQTGNVAFDSSSRTKITFDDIRIVRGQGKNGENWLRLNNIDLIFGDTCEWSGSLGLYIANEAGFYNSTVQIGGKVIVDNLAPLGAWTEGSHIATDNYKFVINGGAVKSIYLVANNGNDSGIPSVITGNVDVEINGGDIDALFLGSRRSDKLDGNAIVTINGGNIKNLYYGNDWTNSQENGNIKNLALVYNVKEILDGGYNVSPIAKREKTNDVKNAVVIVNNSELADTIPSLGVATYSVQVNGGKATPVFDGENVLFDITMDSTDEEGTIYANGKAIEANEDGLYALDKGTTVIKYSAVPPQTITFTYGDKYFEQLWLEGDTVMLPKLPADAVIPEGKEFKGWNAGGVVYAEGYSYEFDGAVLEFTAEFTKVEEKILYLNPQNGNDANDGFSANTAIKTLDEVTERLSAFTSGKATLEIVGTLTDNKIYLPEYSGVLTIQGGTIKWGDGLYLSGNTVFKNVELYATADWKHLNTNGYDMTFDTGVTKASGSKNINVHAGINNSDMNGDNKIVLKSGDIADFRIGPYYITSGTSKKWTGNLELIIDGASIALLEHGDEYSGTNGSFSITGSEKIIIKSGSVDYMNTHKLSKAEGGIQVFDYCDHNFDFNNWDTYNIAIHRFDIYGDIEATFENGKFITDNVVRVKGSNTDLQGMTEFTGLAAGTYSVYPREISFAGARIRLDDPAALRFIFKVNGASSAAKANYGMLVYPTALLGDDVLTHDLVGEGKAKDIEVNKIFAEDSTSFSFSVAIYNIKNTASGYQKEFTVVPYIVEADGSYTYCEAQNCSLYDVAKEATGTDAQNEFIKNIISTVEGSEN